MKAFVSSLFYCALVFVLFISPIGFRVISIAFLLVKLRIRVYSILWANVCGAKNTRQFWKMKQRKSYASDINSSSVECSGHVRSFKRTSKDEFRSRNGNRFRNLQIKSDKPKKACVHGPQNRSQRCLSRNNTVQTSLRNAPIYSKFAFHRIVPLIVILLFTGCCVANGQQTDSQFNAQNTGEWVISCYFTAVVSTAESNLNE